MPVDVQTPARVIPWKVVFFDAAGTLCHLPRGVGFHYAEVLARHGVHRKESALAAAFHSVWKELPAPPAGDGPRPDDDQGWWRVLVTRVLQRCAVSPADLDEPAFFAELYAEFAQPGVWALYPEVLEVLDALAAHYTLGVITNFDGRFRTIAADLGLAGRFQHLIISSETGADKPDPRIFTRALSVAGVDAVEALHVGDDPVCDWEGAAAAGLQVFRLARPENSLRDLLGAL